MSQPARDYRVGMFVFLGLVILSVLIVMYGEEPTWLWATKWDLAVRVDTPRGVEAGTPAFMQGVQVGRVKEITLQNPEQPSLGAAVIIEVDDRYDIPAGSSAELHAKFGFDKGAIHIIPPIRPQPALPKDGSGGIPGLMQGALESVVPEEFIRNLVRAIEEIAKVGAVADDLHELLQQRSVGAAEDPGEEVMANLYTLIQRIDQTFRLVNDVLESGGTQDFGEAMANLRAASENLKEWTSGLDRHTDQLADQTGSTIRAFDERTREVAAATVESFERLSDVLDELYEASRAINQRQGLVGKAIYDPKLYEELVTTAESLRLTIDELRATLLWLKSDSRLAPGNL